MPYTFVEYGGSGVTQEDYSKLLPLLDALPEVVAKAFHIESNKKTHLKPEEIVVTLTPLPVIRRNTKNIEVRIEMPRSLQRIIGKRERTSAVHDFIRGVVPSHLSLAVFVVFVDCEYIESEGTK